MKGKAPTDAETEQLTLNCGFCGAKPGEWCTTRTGRASPLLHSDRYYQWIDVRRLGRLNQQLGFQDHPADPAEYLPPRPTNPT